MRYFLPSLLFLWSIVLSAQTEYFLEETYAISPSGTLHLESEDADVTITTSDRTDVYVKIDYSLQVKGISSKKYHRFEFEIKEKGGDLYLSEKSEYNVSFMIGSMKELYTIEIDMPATVSLDLEGEDDDYYIFDVAGNIRLETEDGDATIKNYHGKDFNYKTEDGDLQLDQGYGSINIETEDGDILVSGGNFDNVYLESEDGEVEFETNLVETGSYVFRSEDGDLELIFPQGSAYIEISHDESDIRTTQHYRVLEDSDEYTVVQSNDGKSRVKVKTEDGDIRIGH